MSDPTTLGAKVDAFYKARQKRLDAEKKIEEMKKVESAQKEEILRMLAADRLEGAKGKLATVAITHTDFVRVEDIAALHKYIAADPTNRLDLLERRASKMAVLDRMANGVEVPGVLKETRIDLSFTKR